MPTSNSEQLPTTRLKNKINWFQNYTTEKLVDMSRKKTAVCNICIPNE